MRHAYQPAHPEVVLGALFAALLVSACSNSVSPTTGDPTLVAGVWDWTEHFDDPSSSVPTCDDTGTYVFTVVGSGFVGRSDQVGTCSSTQGPIANNGSDSVVSGSVSDVQMKFTVGLVGGCQYSAMLSSTPDHLSGSATCGTATGTWTADRGQALTSVAVSPARASIPVSAAFPLEPVLRNALGNRVFDRAITWSSDAPAVAGVDSLGNLTAVLQGTAHIQAAAEGLFGVAAITVAGVTDPDSVGDTFGPAPFIDILALSAASDSNDLTVAIRLSAPAGIPVYGWLDLDVDQDSTTGVEATVDIFRPDTTQSSGLGIEYYVDISSGTVYDAVTGAPVGTAPLYYDVASGTGTLRIPVSLLGSARANMALVVGNVGGATDIAPSTGHLTLSGPTLTAAQLSAAPRATLRFLSPWRGGAPAPLSAQRRWGKLP